MLKSLSIQNFILIEDIEIDFHKGLNIITGETGAGKSIIIQALGLLLGNRLTSTPLFNADNKCVIEGVFNHVPLPAKDFLKENEFEVNEELIIRREISTQGKSRAFINDTPANLNDLKDLMIHVLDIHAQQDTFSKLLSDTFFIEVADRLADNELLFKKYSAIYSQWNSQNKKLQELKKIAESSQNEIDFNTFLWEEIQEVNINIEEDTNLESRLNLIKNAELIKTTLFNALGILSEAEINISDMLRESYRLISSAAQDSGDKLGKALENADNIIEQTDDLIKELSNFSNSINFDEEEYALLSERNNKISRLLKKHQLVDVILLSEFQNQLKAKIDSYSSNENLIIELESKLKELQSQAVSYANELSEKRKLQFKHIENSITETLQLIGMQYAQVKIHHTKLDEALINQTGIDSISMLLSPNKGSSFKKLTEVGSGGEKSRLMLAIQNLLAGSIELPTLVLDEIDTGISGEVALKVGTLLKKMAVNYQLISITHLPQIAAKADRHFFAYKDNSSAKTISKVKILTEREQINEISIMLGGENYNASASNHAQSLIKG